MTHGEVWRPSLSPISDEGLALVVAARANAAPSTPQARLPRRTTTPSELRDGMPAGHSILNLVSPTKEGHVWTARIACLVGAGKLRRNEVIGLLPRVPKYLRQNDCGEELKKFKRCDVRGEGEDVLVSTPDMIGREAFDIAGVIEHSVAVDLNKSRIERAQALQAAPPWCHCVNEPIRAMNSFTAGACKGHDTPIDDGD